MLLKMAFVYFLEGTSQKDHGKDENICAKIVCMYARLEVSIAIQF